MRTQGWGLWSLRRNYIAHTALKQGAAIELSVGAVFEFLFFYMLPVALDGLEFLFSIAFIAGLSDDPRLYFTQLVR